MDGEKGSSSPKIMDRREDSDGDEASVASAAAPPTAYVESPVLFSSMTSSSMKVCFSGVTGAWSSRTESRFRPSAAAACAGIMMGECTGSSATGSAKTGALAVGTSTREGSMSSSSTAKSSASAASCSANPPASGASEEASSNSSSKAKSESASSANSTAGAGTTGNSPVAILSSMAGLSGAAPGTRSVRPPIATDSISPVLIGSLASPMIAAASEPSPGNSISSPVRTTLSRSSVARSRWTSDSFSDMLPPL